MLDSNGMKKARSMIGYCPQHNALIGILTVREHLEMYGMIKGLSGKDLGHARDLWVEAMDLKAHQWKLAGNLSGGNKRKLCVATAMIGDPEVILLDEPSAGMDPEARRFMWNVIAEIAQTRKQATVVLTTHSMEECEALCNRITIMVNGSFRCLGTHKEVKDLYGAGRQLTIKLEGPSKAEMAELQSEWTTANVTHANARAAPAPFVDNERTGPSHAWTAEAAVKNHTVSRATLAEWAKASDVWLASLVESAVAPFPDTTGESVASVLVLAEWVCNARNAKRVLQWVKSLDESAEWLAWASTTFRFKLFGGGDLPALFDTLYRNKSRLKMSEYAVSPTSLEQIFHTFAKEQTAASGDEQGVYDNAKEKQLQTMFSCIQAEKLLVAVEAPAAELATTPPTDLLWSERASEHSPRNLRTENECEL